MKDKVFFVLFCVLILSSCANNEGLSECLSDTHYGFWGGFLHGFLFPVLLMKSVLFDDASLYAVGNGHMYDLGFVLGILLIPTVLAIRIVIESNSGSFKDDSSHSI